MSARSRFCTIASSCNRDFVNDLCITQFRDGQPSTTKSGEKTKRIYPYKDAIVYR